MKVIGAGFARTGTTSLAAAFTALLGGRCYHMNELLGRGPEMRWWTQRLQDPGQGGAFETMKGFDACTDFPAALVFDELCAQYPDAKVVLTLRDETSWLASWQALYRRASMAARLRSSNPKLVELAELFSAILDRAFDGEVGDDAFVSGFRRHNDRVRELVAEGQLLEFRVEEGWGPLCAFLEVPVPQIEFPRENVGAAGLDGLGELLRSKR